MPQAIRIGGPRPREMTPSMRAEIAQLVQQLDENEPHWTFDASPIDSLRVLVAGEQLHSAPRLAALDARKRADMIKQVRAGEPVTLEVDATTYVQRLTPNRNFVRFKRGTLRSVARSFTGMPMLTDHTSWRTDARLGTILKSQAELTESTELVEAHAVKDVVFRQTLQVVKAHGVEGVLDGTLDRFSIGWRGRDISCSVHNVPLFGRGCCDCWPGDTVDGKLVEAVFNDAVGVEVSAVNVPAVLGTGIDQIRAALSAARGVPPIKRQHQEGATMNLTELRKALGVPDTMPDSEVLALASRRASEHSVLTAKQVELESAAKRAQHEAAVARAAQEANEIETIISTALADQRIATVIGPDGKRVQSKVEIALREMGAALGVDAMRETADKLPRQGPAGLPSQSLTTPGTTKPTSAHPADANAHLASGMASVGLTREDIDNYGPQNRFKANGEPHAIPPNLVATFSSRNLK